jgi:hypothetical protein
MIWAMQIACMATYKILVRKSEGIDWRIMLRWSLEK